MPLIIPANTLSAAGYDVDNSCRFDDGSSPNLTKSVGSSATTKYTLSLWIKRSSFGAYQRFVMSSGGGGLGDVYFRFQNVDTMALSTVGDDSGFLITNRKFRDPSAWFHMVVRYDSTESTANDRFRLYINGVDERDVGGYSTDTMPTSSEADNITASGNTFRIGGDVSGQYFDGYMAEVHFSEGYSYAPTEFGEFDSNSPTIWKPKEASISYGTSGFYLDYEASDNLGNDANGGTDFSESNLAAADQATDTPTNNFCTINPLIDSRIGFSEGNLALSFNVTDTQLRAGGTIGASAGKWYWEQKVTSSGNTHYFGIKSADSALTSTAGVSGSPSMYYNNDGTKSYNTSSSGDSYGNTFTDNDIISVALDLDNSAIYFAKNGTWENSGDPTSGGTATGAAFSGTGSSDGFPSTQSYLPFVIGQKGGAAFTLAMNFGGCPAFTISSGNADGDGYGNFEYAVPSGYYALCTKNLGAYGG